MEGKASRRAVLAMLCGLVGAIGLVPGLRPGVWFALAGVVAIVLGRLELQAIARQEAPKAGLVPSNIGFWLGVVELGLVAAGLVIGLVVEAMQRS